MFSLIAFRLALAVPTLLVISGLSFLLVSFAPGDAATTILGTTVTAEQLENLREKLGLNLPVYLQYWTWLKGAVQLDFGQSLLSGQDVMIAISQRVWPTVSLVVATMILTVLLGLTLGIIGAVRGGVIGRFVDFLSMIGVAVPNFILAFVLALVFAVWLGWLPPGGYVRFGDDPMGWARSMVLPTVSMALFSTGLLAKQVRAAMSDALQSEYIFNLIANGFSTRSVVLKHALKNASLPILATAGVLFAGLLSGTVLVESLFYFPGLGSYAVSASASNDLPVVQAVTVIFTMAVILINLFIDIGYGLLNPTLKAQH